MTDFRDYEESYRLLCNLAEEIEEIAKQYKQEHDQDRRELIEELFYRQTFELYTLRKSFLESIKNDLKVDKSNPKIREVIKATEKDVAQLEELLEDFQLAYDETLN